MNHATTQAIRDYMKNAEALLGIRERVYTTLYGPLQPCRYVDTDDLEPGVLDAVKGAVLAAATALDVDPPAIRFFRRAGAGEVKGCEYRPKCLSFYVEDAHRLDIRHDLEPERAAHTAAFEMYRAAYDDEAGAEAFADRVVYAVL